ncbi:prolyl-tRNA synthetase associated domain-containing protein [Chelativorans sp. AA-79]|uniref:prolyl-tRNA synthetase associated domain-containing protein n=1 Tax=Chelativorans sp. AA-79 TaxID=3028735 RepID=UPI0023F89433|nr:prolyl-tRNA synthetase associated domain-containing protein [Chelativorans sp. AA-79]WEX09631.1 prolyl-tRNA synthetase associated domain-containing protein [Chelativorans sp. AA-79]
MPKTPDDLMRHLAELGIEVSTYGHPPLFTVEESRGLRGKIPGAHTKNLFLKDRKGRYFLLTVAEDARVDLKAIHHTLGASGRLSFGSAERLEAFLGVAPGSVTVFGVINDDLRQVTVVLDEQLMESDVINAHPLHNEATTSIRRSDLLRFLRSTGHEPLILKVSQ